MGEESFEVRVKRLFGSRLFDSLPGSLVQTGSSSLWSVANGEVERHEWNRDRGGADREDDPCASAFDEKGGCFAKRVRDAKRDRRKEWEGDLDDLDDEEEDGRGGEDYGGEDEEGEIRASVGLDPALDHEEEEDEYDRTALNCEDIRDRVYMKDAFGHGPGLNFQSVVHDFHDDPFEENHDFSLDPRADHFAASVRLNEDKKATENGHPVLNHRVEQSSHSQIKIAEDDTNLKSILKRKGSQIDPKPRKRVRFEPECKDDDVKTVEEPLDSHMVPQFAETVAAGEVNSHLAEESTNVPDFLRNPSKYTCYTLDLSINDDDQINKQAFEDFRSLVKRSNPDQGSQEIPMELPKKITFVPRRKANDPMSVDNNSGDIHEEHIKDYDQNVACATGVDSYDDNTCEMEEDETSIEEIGARTRKDGRRYRSKSS